jgi:two-component system osmolarity sensor histidine kinase EnvZ
MANLRGDAKDGMQSDLGQMNAIIGQFLDYAKPTDSASFTQVDLSALLTDAARETSRLPDVTVNTEIAAGIEVMGNAIDLKRVISNLIENARRYGKPANTDLTEIEMNARLAGDRAIIEIGDRGPGIPEPQMERLLRPFTRLDIARGQGNGAGLGLAIVERVVKRHGGKLRLSNRAAGGLKIEIEIPRANSGFAES